jgi:acetoin utilization deacetylase AcuC-like enzyme
MTRSRFAQMKATQPSMKPQKVGVVYDDIMLLHRSHMIEHPERPERLMAVYLNLVKKDLYKRMVEIHSDQAEQADLLLAHCQKHVLAVQKCSFDKKFDVELKPKQNVREFSHDTYQNKFTSQAAITAAGSTIEAVRAVCS